MHPMLEHDPIPADAAVVCLCEELGICGFPRGHSGNHVPNHALVQCLDPFTCPLCLYRSRRRNAAFNERYKAR